MVVSWDHFDVDLSIGTFLFCDTRKTNETHSMCRYAVVSSFPNLRVSDGKFVTWAHFFDRSNFCTRTRCSYSVLLRLTHAA
jgi:hypothetical protein